MDLYIECVNTDWIHLIAFNFMFITSTLCQNGTAYNVLPTS